MKDSLFFGIEIHAPWPKLLQHGRLLHENDRHLTLAFLGNQFTKEAVLERLPKPQLSCGFAGFFDAVLFLPEKQPHVVAWHLHWEEDIESLLSYRNQLLEEFDIRDTRPFKPHVTVARSPSHLQEWKKAFTPLPFYTSHLHLYESLGHSTYRSLWTFPIIPPFEEIAHTADRAYLIRGENHTLLFHHAKLALAFTFPALMQFFPKEKKHLHSLEEVIHSLNAIVTEADKEIGCPFKAISYHGKEGKKTIFEWEMIIDV